MIIWMKKRNFLHSGPFKILSIWTIFKNFLSLVLKIENFSNNEFIIHKTLVFIHAEQMLTYTKNESLVVQCILHAYIKMSVTVLATS